MNNNLTIWSHWCAVKGTRNGRRRLTVPLKVAFASHAGSIVSDAATAAAACAAARERERGYSNKNVRKDSATELA